jgi:hypothetical protein
MSTCNIRFLGIFVGLTLCLLGYGWDKQDNEEPSISHKHKPIVATDSSGQKWVWTKTDRCRDGAWFPLVSKSASRVVEYQPPQFLAGVMITAIHEDGTAMLMSNVEASKRTMGHADGVDAWPPVAPEK